MSHTLIFSDTHLGPRFQPSKFDLLRRIISEADQVVINGDFWEAYLWDFETFLGSRWSGLFPLLKERRAVYLYGNHDRERLSDERRTRFCQEAGTMYDLKSGGRAFHIEHGNRMAPELDETHPGLAKGPLGKVVPLMESWGLPLVTEKRLERRYRGQNERMKAWASENLSAGEILVCGHSHLAEVSLEEQFANSGLIKWGIAQYLTLRDGEVTLHSERY